MKIDFKLKEKTRANKFYIFVNYEGGDADTDHPEEYGLEGVDGNNYKDNLDKIEQEVSDLKTLEKILNEHGTSSSHPYNIIKEEYGERFSILFEDVPNDPQCDYQYKCSLDHIKLIRYDNEGNRYESWV